MAGGPQPGPIASANRQLRSWPSTAYGAVVLRSIDLTSNQDRHVSSQQPGTTGTVVVTGAAKGIGAAIVRRLVADGFRVIAGVRRTEDAQVLRGELGERVVPVLLDITDPDAVAAAAELVDGEARDHGLAGLVNNAGIAVAAPLEFLPPAELRRQLEVNVVGQHAITQALVPLLRRGRGRIVNLGSIGGRIVAPMTGPYHVSKFALRAWSDTLRLELSPWGIQVVLVEPGAVATPIWETSIAAAERLQQTLPSAMEALYGRAIAAARTSALRSATRGMPADQVAAVVARALTVRRPRARYLVGTDARITAMVARLPDRLRDRLVLSQSGGATGDRATTTGPQDSVPSDPS
jgi:NAD(P)-dependent dehydrogenase (short-subunit alcohol dehydrogenase family)